MIPQMSSEAKKMVYPGFATLLRELDSSFTPSEQGAQKYQQKEGLMDARR